MIRYTRRREGSGSMTFTASKRHGAARRGSRSAGIARRPERPRARRGFTLIETALATIIVGVGVVAIVSAQQAFHIKNNWSTHASTATLLGNEIREMTLNLPRHDPVTGEAYWGSEPNETWVGDFDFLCENLARCDQGRHRHDRADHDHPHGIGRRVHRHGDHSANLQDEFARWGVI